MARSYTSVLPCLPFSHVGYFHFHCSPSYRTRSTPLFASRCPYHSSLLSCSFFKWLSCFQISMAPFLSFHILSSFVTLHNHRSIRISATSNLFPCHRGNDIVSAPYIIVGLPTVLYTFSLVFVFFFLSHVAQHSRHPLPVLPPAMHSLGDFCIQFSILRHHRPQSTDHCPSL